MVILPPSIVVVFPAFTALTTSCGVLPSCGTLVTLLKLTFPLNVICGVVPLASIVNGAVLPVVALLVNFSLVASIQNSLPIPVPVLLLSQNPLTYETPLTIKLLLYAHLLVATPLVTAIPFAT